MPNAAPILPDFSGGEVGALIQGRVDFAPYKKSVASMVNWVATLQGPPTRRPGSVFVAAAKDPAHPVRLLPFVFSNSQSYVLEFGQQYCRVYTEEGQLLRIVNITGISKAASAVVTSNSHLLVVGQTVTFAGVVGMTQINGLTGVISAVTTNTFTVNVNSSGFTVYASGGTATAVAEFATPYLGADLDAIYFAQSADTLYLCHPKYPVQKVIRNASDIFSLVQVAFSDGPYNSVVITTLTFDSASGAVNITSSVPIFAASDVTGFHRLIRVYQSSVDKIGVIQLTGVSNANDAAGTWISTTGSSANAGECYLGLWCDTNGYPNCITFHENRLWFGAGPILPNRLISSVSADFENMAPTPLPAGATTVPDATDSVVLDINSEQINAIVWLASNQRGLQVGTIGSEFLITPGSTTDFIQPASVFARNNSNLGSQALQPVRIDRATVFVQRAGLKLREMYYFFVVDGFESEDLTILDDQVSASGLRSITVTREPYPVIWGVRNDGVLIGCTYKRDTSQLHVAWHRHVLGGRSSTAGDPSLVLSATAIPTTTAPPGNGVQDELWLAVQRSVNGSTVVYIEYLSPYYNNTPQNFALPVNALQLDALGTRADGAHITGATNANPCVISVDASIASVGDTITIDGVYGMTQLNGRIWKVGATGAGTLTLQNVDGTNLNSTAFGMFSAGPPGSFKGFAFKRITAVNCGSYLNGETISVLADASPVAGLAVSAGAAALQNSAGFMVWGFPYNSDIVLLRFEAGSATGTSEAKTQRIHRVGVRVFNTGNIKAALNNVADAQYLIPQPANAIAGLGNALTTGVLTTQLPKSGQSTDERIVLRVSDPLPATILNIAPLLETQDRT